MTVLVLKKEIKIDKTLLKNIIFSNLDRIQPMVRNILKLQSQVQKYANICYIARSYPEIYTKILIFTPLENLGFKTGDNFHLKFSTCAENQFSKFSKLYDVWDKFFWIKIYSSFFFEKKLSKRFSFIYLSNYYST